MDQSTPATLQSSLQKSRETHDLKHSLAVLAQCMPWMQIEQALWRRCFHGDSATRLLTRPCGFFAPPCRHAPAVNSHLPERTIGRIQRWFPGSNHTV